MHAVQRPTKVLKGLSFDIADLILARDVRTLLGPQELVET